ncbi:progranulin-like isoform X1 [Parambassis ranga]|uniref:Progranulin-like isoform X1 n=1 Tax=Parambassis ranga TaxID=210632 RepID=A0A6P7JQY5_9TELE|nr:progranulin-like isoform X1 [Parambassis ranga]XP_028279256.1 progranulin-like isoform X1 [Parambassis ranga]
MFGITLSVLVATFVCDLALGGSIKCPDGNTCSDSATCCRTRLGYSCCPYPNAVCCSDLAHCCPSGFHCNLATQMCEKADQPWLNIPMVKKEAGEEVSTLDLSVSPFQELKDSLAPEQTEASVVHCDNYHSCPDGTTCCRHPKGVWFCCPYSSGRCCLDGFHCCPYGYDCDLTYTHCVRQSLRYPFPSKQALSSVPASRISASETDDSLTPVAALTEASSSPSDYLPTYPLVGK